MMPIITLTTDFGLADGFVGMMKGVILGIAPSAQIVDLSHDISPQNIVAAHFVLERCVPYFPQGTIHLVVVDPGVGGARRPILVTDGASAYVGPDNGVLTLPLQSPSAQAWLLDRTQYWITPLSQTFHARDLFAPVAAHLASGIRPADLATPINDPARLVVSRATRLSTNSVSGHVVGVDRFGNLLTDVPADWVQTDGRWRCSLHGADIYGLQLSYDSVERGQLLLLVGSGNRLEIALRDGSAAAYLGVAAGETLKLDRE